MGGENEGGADPMVICAWCSKLLKLGRGAVSHGICKACHQEYFPGIPYEGDEATQHQAVTSEKLSPFAPVGASPSWSPVATGANSSARRETEEGETA